MISSLGCHFHMLILDKIKNSGVFTEDVTIYGDIKIDVDEVIDITTEINFYL